MGCLPVSSAGGPCLPGLLGAAPSVEDLIAGSEMEAKQSYKSYGGTHSHALALKFLANKAVPPFKRKRTAGTLPGHYQVNDFQLF